MIYVDRVVSRADTLALGAGRATRQGQTGTSACCTMRYLRTYQPRQATTPASDQQSARTIPKLRLQFLFPGACVCAGADALYRRWRTVLGFCNPKIVSKSDGFCIENEKLCIKNEELCIKNERNFA